MSDPLAEALEAVRSALRRGDYAALASLSLQIERSLQSAATLPRDRLEALREDAGRTAACLAAARSGFRAARRRLAEIRAGSDGFATYDRSGRSTPCLPLPGAGKRL